MKRLPILFSAILTTSVFAQTSSPPGSVLSSSGGRYVFGQVSEYRRDQLLLDTQTGRLWQFVCVEKDAVDQKTCIANGLQPVPFMTSKGEFHGSVPPATPSPKP